MRKKKLKKMKAMRMNGEEVDLDSMSLERAPGLTQKRTILTSPTLAKRTV